MEQKRQNSLCLRLRGVREEDLVKPYRSDKAEMGGTTDADGDGVPGKNLPRYSLHQSTLDRYSFIDGVPLFLNRESRILKNYRWY